MRQLPSDMSDRRLRILHCSAYFAPAWAFGGPPRSLLALCQAQAAHGLDLEVFTTTANPGAPLPASPEGHDVGGVRVRYYPVSPPARLLGAASMAGPLAEAMTRADVVHLHGLFNRTVWMASRLARQARVPVAVSPRGMLQPAALGHHAWRKTLTWMLCDRQVVRDAVCVHATSAMEQAELARRFGSGRVVDIPNVVQPVQASSGDVALARARVRLPDRARFILALGRVHPIKRLDLLASAFVSIAARWPDVHVVVAGPDEAGHWLRVRPRFAPFLSRVHWVGEVDARVKAGLLSDAAMLVACSDSESFGMSIAEALSAGTPVVVTETCPWPLIEREACGWWVPQRPSDIALAIDRVLLDPAESRTRAAQGRALVAAHFSPAVVSAAWGVVYARLASTRMTGRPRTAA